MFAQFFRKPMPAPSLVVFVALQCLDILTTLLGLELGAREASIFIGRLMHAGPVAALLIAKIFAVFLVATALRFRRPKLVVLINYWFAGIVTWNIVMIVARLVLNNIR